MKYLTENERRAVLELKDILSKEYGLIEIRLFGSKARGSKDWESDIDLFILLEDYDWEREKKICHVCFEIGLKYDVFLSPILYSRKEVEDRLTRASHFFKTVQREGIPL